MATTRRDLLGTGAFTTFAGIASGVVAKPDQLATMGNMPTVAATRPDAGLIDLTSQFMALQARIDANDDGLIDDGDADMRGLIAAQARLLDEMAETPATTLEGHQARARALMGWYSVQGEEDTCHSIIQWDRLWPLFRDLLGEMA